MTTEDYKITAQTIPHQPGVYQFIDENKTVIYVGKAKNLKKRISSYFGEKKSRARKTKIMVRTAIKFKFTIVESEIDALLLESNLIKKLQPKYNVMLKDGKSYSYLCIKKERFPRVFLTRRVIKDGSTYFGPYISRHQIKTILDLIKQLFPLRTCSLKLMEKNIISNKFKVCLEYHIKNCLGPCVGYESEQAYNDKILQIKNILKGSFSTVKKHFKEQMQIYAEHLEFEKAQQIKEKLLFFQDYQAKSTVVSTTIKDVDVFAIDSDDQIAYISYMKVVNGAIVSTFSMEAIKNIEEEKDPKILSHVISFIRAKFNSITTELIVPFDMEIAEEKIHLTIPIIGDKKKLLNLAQKNATYLHLQNLKIKASKISKQTSFERILTTLKEDLRMNSLPMHIECFDNSNLQGSFPVSSCVVFKNAKPSKRDYRKFNIKTVEGPNDFASMEEVVHRRYSRLLKEKEPLPDLIIIDGGKGQLSSTMKIIRKLEIEKRVTVIGIAKRLEEIFFPGDPIPIYINKKSESLKLIQQLRNEAHRFAITFHRNKRSKAFTVTELTKIAGIGNKIAQKLLSKLGSVNKIKNTSENKLIKLVGNSTAQKIIKHFDL